MIRRVSYSVGVMVCIDRRFRIFTDFFKKSSSRKIRQDKQEEASIIIGASWVAIDTNIFNVSGLMSAKER